MWKIIIPHRVEKALNGLPDSVRDAVFTALEELEQSPWPAGHKKLKGRLNCWRLRVGAYRILYDIDQLHRSIIILKIGLRKDIYRSH